MFISVTCVGTPVSLEQFLFCFLFVCLSKENKMLSSSTWDADLEQAPGCTEGLTASDPKGRREGACSHGNTLPCPTGLWGVVRSESGSSGVWDGVNRGRWWPSS